MKTICRMIVTVICFHSFALGDMSFDKIGSWTLQACYSVSFDSISSHNYALVGTDSSVVVINVDSPATPTKVSEVNCGGKVRKIVCKNSTVYALTDSTQLKLIDIANPNAPKLASSIDSIPLPYMPIIHRLNFAAADNYLLIVNQQKLFVFNTQNPYEPTMIWNDSFPGAHVPNDIAIQGNYVYLALSYTPQFQILNISNPYSPVFLGDYNLGNDDRPHPTGIYVNKNYAFVLFNRNWNSNSQIALIDISNPDSPAVIGNMDYLRSYGFNPDMIALIDSFVIVTVHQDRTIQSAYINFHYTDTRNLWVEECHFPLDTFVEDFTVDNDRIYVVNGNKGLVILSFSDKTNIQNPNRGNLLIDLNRPWVRLTSYNTIQYFIPFKSYATLSLVNSKGQNLAALFKKELIAGTYSMKLSNAKCHNFNYAKLTINKNYYIFPLVLLK